MQERIKEHDRDILLPKTLTFAVSEHNLKTEHACSVKTKVN